MKQDTILKFLVLTTLLLLIIILLSYFGIFRYFTLHFQSSEKYINEYSNLPKADDGRVVISFTTTPDKINNILPMLNSILDQTVKVDQISLNIPYKCEGKEYNIPDQYKDIVNI